MQKKKKKKNVGFFLEKTDIKYSCITSRVFLIPLVVTTPVMPLQQNV